MGVSMTMKKLTLFLKEYFQWNLERYKARFLAAIKKPRTIVLTGFWGGVWMGVFVWDVIGPHTFTRLVWCITICDGLGAILSEGIAAHVFRKNGGKFNKDGNPIIERPKIQLVEIAPAVPAAAAPVEIVSEPANTAPLTFNAESGLVTLGSRTCQLPPFQNEHELYRAMATYPIGKPVDWSLLHAAMTGELIKDWRKDKKMVYDAYDQLNARLLAELGIENLFVWENKTIRKTR